MRLWLCATVAILSYSNSQGADDLTLTWLANAGAVLRSGSDAIVIDAFVNKPHSIYAALDENAQKALLEGEPVIGKVKLALVSHRHRDHFQADAAITFLKKHPETILVSSQQVVDALSAEPGFEMVREQVEMIFPRPGEIRTWKRDGLSVDFINLAHGGERFKDIQNLGHIIHIGGKRVLHVGDAATKHNLYKPYVDHLKDIDLALIPYWFYQSKSGQALLSQVIHSKHEAAIHIPPQERSQIIRSFSNTHPNVILSGSQLTTLIL